MRRPHAEGSKGLKAAPKAHGLYDPRHEPDSCGVSIVVHLKGQKSNAIVQQALQVMINLGEVLSSQDDLELAAETFMFAAEGYDELLGPGSPSSPYPGQPGCAGVSSGLSPFTAPYPGPPQVL